jgi:DNA-binding CsgD family transcriptional regulator/PAS domain-containing protein
VAAKRVLWLLYGLRRLTPGRRAQEEEDGAAGLEHARRLVEKALADSAFVNAVFGPERTAVREVVYEAPGVRLLHRATSKRWRCMGCVCILLGTKARAGAIMAGSELERLAQPCGHAMGHMRRQSLSYARRRPGQSESEQLSVLIGDIYDTALDPELWPPVLQKVCTFVRGSMASILSQDPIKNTANIYFSWGIDQYYENLYLDRYYTLNPLFPAILFFPAGDVYGVADIMSHAEMGESRLYKEWMEPQGFIDFVGCTLEKSATSVAFHAVVRHRSDGFVDDEARRRMRLVGPHVRRAILVGKVIDLSKVEAAVLADALDGLAAGMFLVDSSGRIAHANAAGQEMLAEGSVVSMAGTQLLANEPQANQTLREVLERAAAGDAALGTNGIAVPLAARNGMDHIAHVLPLNSARRRQAGMRYGAVAAIFVQRATLDLRSPLEAVSRRYGLTAGELRVLDALVSGGNVSAMANLLGISEGTVRNHLHRLFAKTGTSRQADLVKLASGFASPLTS